MQYLADKNHWRDTFKDQLNVNFKEWMLDAVAKNIENNQRSCTFKESLCDEQLATIGSTKDPIKRKVQFDLQKKEKFRMIESKDKRIVHFLFNPGFASKITLFSRKYKRFLDGSLESFTNT